MPLFYCSGSPWCSQSSQKTLVQREVTFRHPSPGNVGNCSSASHLPEESSEHWAIACKRRQASPQLWQKGGLDMISRKESMVAKPRCEPVPLQLRTKCLYIFAGPWHSPCHFLQARQLGGCSLLALVNPTHTCPALPGSAQDLIQSWIGKHMR